MDNLNSELDASLNVCPTCHQTVKKTDYYCFNCGANLKPAPPSTTVASQLTLYLKSFFFPPLGFVWGFKYLRQSDAKSKLIGFVAMGITAVLLVVIVITTVRVVNTVDEQVNKQLNQMMF